MSSGYDSYGSYGSSNAVIDFTPARLFNPPRGSDTPDTLFDIWTRNGWFTRRSNPQQLLIFTDGACTNNGDRSGRSVVGGCAFAYRNAAFRASGVCFRLENRGPSGALYTHTINRAELRAVIAALQYREWNCEGFNKLVIATDSVYVALGATQWVESWVRRGWRTAKGTPVLNQDLWKLLFKIIGLGIARGNRFCNPETL